MTEEESSKEPILKLIGTLHSQLKADEQAKEENQEPQLEQADQAIPVWNSILSFLHQVTALAPRSIPERNPW